MTRRPYLQAHPRYATPLPPDSARRDVAVVVGCVAFFLVLGLLVACKAPGPW